MNNIQKEDILSYCSAQLQDIVAILEQSTQIEEIEKISQMLCQLIDNIKEHTAQNDNSYSLDVVLDSYEKDRMDAKRYRFIARGLVSDDGRPHISQAIYKNGVYSHTITLTESEANRILDKYLSSK